MPIPTTHIDRALQERTAVQRLLAHDVTLSKIARPTHSPTHAPTLSRTHPPNSNPLSFRSVPCRMPMRAHTSMPTPEVDSEENPPWTPKDHIYSHIFSCHISVLITAVMCSLILSRYTSYYSYVVPVYMIVFELLFLPLPAKTADSLFFIR